MNNKIVGVHNIVKGDSSSFEKGIMDVVKTISQKYYDIEIQYSSFTDSGMGNVSALIIVREKA